MNPKESKGLWFKAHKVSIEVKRIEAGMLGEMGGNSRWGWVEWRWREDQRCQKYFFCLTQKPNKNQIDLGWNICTGSKHFVPVGSKNLNWFKKFCTKGKNWTTTFNHLWYHIGACICISTVPYMQAGSWSITGFTLLLPLPTGISFPVSIYIYSVYLSEDSL